MNISFKIEGAEELLGRLNETVSGDKMNRALSAAGEEVRSEAAARAPTDTGTLRRSIVCNVEENSALVGPTVGYGAYVEFGTGAKGDPSVAHTTKKYWRYCKGGRFYTTSGQAPKPYLVPALKACKNKVEEKFREVYGDV